MEFSTVGSVRDKHDFAVRIIPVVGIGDFRFTTRVPPAMSREPAGVRTAMEKMLVEVDAVLRHEGEEGDAIVVVGEVGVVG